MDSCSWQEVPADPKDLAAEVGDLEDVPADPEDVATEVEDLEDEDQCIQMFWLMNQFCGFNNTPFSNGLRY